MPYTGAPGQQLRRAHAQTHLPDVRYEARYHLPDTPGGHCAPRYHLPEATEARHAQRCCNSSAISDWWGGNMDGYYRGLMGQ